MVIQKTSRKEKEIASKSIFHLGNTVEAISRQKAKGVKIKIRETGEFVTVPTKALDLLFYILNNMAEGKSFSLVPSDAEITTQQAADMLNVSRPHIVKLLEDGIIPHKKVGSHRRILHEDLIAYDRRLKAQKDTSLKHPARQTHRKLIKPILYHSFEEKKQIERDLLATMPAEKRKAVAVSLMSIFHTAAGGKKRMPLRKSSVKR